MTRASYTRPFLVAALIALFLAACGPSTPYRENAALPEPVQKDFRRPPASVFLENGFWLEPVAHYEVEALVVGAERYRWDELAEVSPMDLALAWGKLAEPHITPLVSIRQSGRWFYWRIEDDETLRQLGRRVIEASMANTHMIPATPEIKELLLSVEAGQAIRAKGFLVDVRHTQEQNTRRTSRLRSDTGEGSCEVLYVTELTVL